MELESVKQVRARQLFNAGFKTIEQVASCKPNDMIAKINNLPLAVATKIVKSAHVIYLYSNSFNKIIFVIFVFVLF